MKLFRFDLIARHISDCDFEVHETKMVIAEIEKVAEAEIIKFFEDTFGEYFDLIEIEAEEISVIIVK